jgi:hypothetical protein
VSDSDTFPSVQFGHYWANKSTNQQINKSTSENANKLALSLSENQFKKSKRLWDINHFPGYGRIIKETRSKIRKK